MKRLFVLAGLAGLMVTAGAAATPPSPYVQFHQATYYEGTHSQTNHVEYIQVDSVGNGEGHATHAYFSTVQENDPHGGRACATTGDNGPDYIKVKHRLLAWDHEGPMMVPITICGENHSEIKGTITPSVQNCGEAIPLVLTPFDDGHTHYGRTEATLCIENAD
jgi:hypothetical protein